MLMCCFDFSHGNGSFGDDFITIWCNDNVETIASMYRANFEPLKYHLHKTFWKWSSYVTKTRGIKKREHNLLVMLDVLLMPLVPNACGKKTRTGGKTPARKQLRSTLNELIFFSLSVELFFLLKQTIQLFNRFAHSTVQTQALAYKKSWKTINYRLVRKAFKETLYARSPLQFIVCRSDNT